MPGILGIASHKQGKQGILSSSSRKLGIVVPANAVAKKVKQVAKPAVSKPTIPQMKNTFASFEKMKM